MNDYIYRVATVFAVIKGATIAIATAALDITFWKSVIIAVISGSIGAAGAIGAALVAVRESRENRDAIKDVQKSLGVNRREKDDGRTDSHTHGNG